MTRFLFPVAALLLSASMMRAQTAISFSEAKPYDKNRYADIKASPYFLESFSTAWITNTEGIKYDPVKANYNGYTEEFEILDGNQFIRLEEKFYNSILLLPEGKVDTVYFIRGVHEDFRGKFIQQLYKSEKVTFVRKFKVGLTSSIINNVGRKDEIKRFSPQNDLFISVAGTKDLIPLKGNANRLLKTLGKEKALKAFLKQNKSIDLDTDQGLIALVKYWEELSY